MSIPALRPSRSADTIKQHPSPQIPQSGPAATHSPGVNFWLTTSGNTDLGLLGEETEAAAGEEGGEALSLCVGLSQKGMQRRRLAGRPPSTGSQSNERFRVAHAILLLSLTLHTQNKLCFASCRTNYALRREIAAGTSQERTLRHDFVHENRERTDFIRTQPPIWRNETREGTFCADCSGLCDGYGYH
ncbi:hypothetical protein Zmor_015725 [Zophobas morio]|uniref:Uncharacterized protein n=1 Tax=Zophobas morio TaxID=2755281 RepID=A0AA38IHJ0_9CUCU|nr:hypothetical protein Zmor_015725 [Zophobas morio]